MRLLRLSVLGLSTLLVTSAVVRIAAAQGGGRKSALVTVVAGSAAPITDLTARDFVVREDKTQREVIEASPATEPLFISLLVDTTQPPMGVQSPTRDLRAGLAGFVKTVQAASPDAQFSLMEFAGAAVTSVDFTADAGELDKAIQRLFPNQQSAAVLMEALADAGKRLAGKPTPRRAIVSIDFRSQEGSAEQSAKRTAEEVKKAGATVWAISIGNANAAAAREALLNTVTQSSGGMRLSAFEASALEGLLQQVANSLLSQYTVTFARPGDSPVKNLKLETTRGPKVLPSPWMR